MRPKGDSSRASGVCVFCAALALAASAQTAAGESLFRADAGLLYDSNLSRAPAPPDIHGDIAGTFDATLGMLFVPNEADIASLGFDVQTQVYRRYHGLDMGSFGLSALYRHKFALGYTAPWASIGVSASDANYGASIRDGPRVIATATLGQRFDAAFDAALALYYDRRYARNDDPVVPGISGAVFDLIAQGAQLSAGYALTDELQIGGNLGIRRGDVVSTTQRSFDIFSVSSAIAPDTTFGPNMFDYRLRGTTRSVAANLSYALDGHTSVNAAVGGEFTDAAANQNYRSHYSTLTLSYRY